MEIRQARLIPTEAIAICPVCEDGINTIELDVSEIGNVACVDPESRQVECCVCGALIDVGWADFVIHVPKDQMEMDDESGGFSA